MHSHIQGTLLFTILGAARVELSFLFYFCHSHEVFLVFPCKGRICFHNYGRRTDEIKACLQWLCYNLAAFEDESVFAVLPFGRRGDVCVRRKNFRDVSNDGLFMLALM